MKPKLFIGSSSEGRSLADAIHINLMHDAECTVWATGVFGLSDDQREGFRQQLAVSDFAVFVFAADDPITLRGQALMSARDNVIYEAGLFAGRLGFNRCFITIPAEGDFRVPSDLAGMTLGRYENRRDNLEAAVNAFCFQVRQKISQLGLLPRELPDALVALMKQYDDSESLEPMSDRVKHKDDIFNQMVAVGRKVPVKRAELLSQEQRPGSVAALFAIIGADPRSTDGPVLIAVNPAVVKRGHLQHSALWTAIKLKSCIQAADVERVQQWLKRFTNSDDNFLKKLNDF